MINLLEFDQQDKLDIYDSVMEIVESHHLRPQTFHDIMQTLSIIIGRVRHIYDTV